MNAEKRIQWIHNKLLSQSYPNTVRVSKALNVSERQAGRDFRYLKEVLEAPIAYDSKRRGYYYTAPFKLPVLQISDNDEAYLSFGKQNENAEDLGSETALIQMQLGYTAEIEELDRQVLMHVQKFIVGNVQGKRNAYLCEFHSVDEFLSTLFLAGGSTKILSPDWLREQYVTKAVQIINRHKESIL